MKPIITTCYSLEGDGLSILLAYSKLQALLTWGESIGERADSLVNVAALLRSRTEITVGVKVYEYFADVNPPQWFKGEVVAPRRQGLITTRYADNSKIDQEEREVRQWIDVRELPEWGKIVAAVKGGIGYLRNRLDGNLPPQHKHYDCSHMLQILRVVQAFNPAWAASNLTAALVDALAIVKPISSLVPQLQAELHQYITHAKNVSIDHTETSHDHSFTEGVLQFYKDNSSNFPTWAKAARIVFAFTPNSGAAERVFSLLNSMFGDTQTQALGDYVQTAVMLRYNKRPVG